MYSFFVFAVCRYSWLCYPLGDVTAPCFKADSSANRQLNQSAIYLHGSDFVVSGVEYLFELTVMADGRDNATTFQAIKIEDDVMLEYVLYFTCFSTHIEMYITVHNV